MSFGNRQPGQRRAAERAEHRHIGGYPPGDGFNSTFGAVSMATGASIQFSSMDLTPDVVQTFSGPLSVTGAASISEAVTRFSGGSIAFNGGVSVTGVGSSLTVTAVGPVTFGTPTTTGLSVAAGNTVLVNNPNGTAVRR